MKNVFVLMLVLGLAAAAGFAADEAPKNPVVVFETSLGNFEVEVYADKAPITAKNFLQYVNDKHYDGCIFHRVIPTFMIQGGGFDEKGEQKKTRDQIKNESGNGVNNDKYNIAMARLQELDSATSQFYINVKDNPNLDKMQYCAFGKVISGTETIDKIRDVPTKTHAGHQNWPTENVVIKSAKVKEEKK